jgi:hypothetical protein
MAVQVETRPLRASIAESCVLVALLAAGAALFAVALGLGLRTALSLAIIGAAVGVANAGLRRRREALRRHRGDEIEQRRTREESAARLLWAASRDFLLAGWGRCDLETLRLLALNIAPGQILGARLAERVARSVSSVRSGVLDRLDDLVSTAGELELAPEAVVRLRSAGRLLAAELDGAVCGTGAKVPFRPPAVALACGQALEACAALRKALRPLLIADAPRLVRWLAGARYGGQLRTGALVLEFSDADAVRVAVRPLDLTRALDELLGRVLGSAGGAGPVRVSHEIVGRKARLSLSWVAPRRGRLDPQALLDALRPLASYGAQLVLEETPEDGRALLAISLPLAEDADELAEHHEADAS